MDHSGLVKLHLTADLVPKLANLELRNIPENCKFHVIVPTLKNIWIHHYGGAHIHGKINDMLAAATELETFETYKLWVHQELRFAGNHLKKIDLHRSDGMPGISFWAPNLEKLRLQGCFQIRNIEILKSHPLAEKLPKGHELTTFRVNTLNANIGRRAMKALKKSGRCFFEENDPADAPPTEAHFQWQHKFQEDYDEDDGMRGILDFINASFDYSSEKMKELDKMEK